ncbi:MAG: ribonuclease HIII [Acholeplasmataceae bacterium]
MRTHTLSLESDKLTKLRQLYQKNLLNVNQPYVLFAARQNDVQITAYKTGKVVLQGDEVSSELVTIKTYLDITDFAAIGSDEVGTGDLFGPVVVCSVYTKEEDIAYLESLNVRDSKRMSNREIIKLGPQIAKKLTHSIIILSPDKYNQMVDEGYNLNKIKALLHNHMIIKTTSKVTEPVPVIIDQFCLPNHYFNYLKDEPFVYSDVEFHVDGENVHLSVAAASIIARYAFLAKMHQQSKKYGYKLKLGAGKDVDEQLKEIVSDLGIKVLPKIAKMNFKNISKLNLD